MKNVLWGGTALAVAGVMILLCAAAGCTGTGAKISGSGGSSATGGYSNGNSGFMSYDGSRTCNFVGRYTYDYEMEQNLGPHDGSGSDLKNKRSQVISLQGREPCMMWPDYHFRSEDWDIQPIPGTLTYRETLENTGDGGMYDTTEVTGSYNGIYNFTTYQSDKIADQWTSITRIDLDPAARATYTKNHDWTESVFVYPGNKIVEHHDTNTSDTWGGPVRSDFFPPEGFCTYTNDNSKYTIQCTAHTNVNKSKENEFYGEDTRYSFNLVISVAGDSPLPSESQVTYGPSEEPITLAPLVTDTPPEEPVTLAPLVTTQEPLAPLIPSKGS